MSDMSHIVELHLHLDGSLRPETVWELAKEQGVELPANAFMLGDAEISRFDEDILIEWKER